MSNLTAEIKEYCLNLGYSRIGITNADDFTEFAEHVRSRGEVYDFFTKGRRDPLRGSSPKTIIPFARSIIVMVWDYAKTAFPPELLGKIGRVYQGRCYNPPSTYMTGAIFDLMKEFLKSKGMQVKASLSLPDRWAAARAGVATFGKNNFAYADGIGSFIVIRTLAVDAELDYDQPTLDSKCPENCTRCIDACPSKALYAPYRLNPKLCLPFNAWKTVRDPQLGLTDSIPRELRPCMGEQVHGCDICQEVCPRNQARLKNKLPSDPFLDTIAADFSLTKLLYLEDRFYETRVKPIMYNYIEDRKFFQRNAAVAIGNSGDPAYLPELGKELSHPDEAVREHVAWAIGRIGGPAATALLNEHKKTETSELVLSEIALSLS